MSVATKAVCACASASVSRGASGEGRAFKRSARDAEIRATLTVAGHTHGGQVQLWPRTLFGEEKFDPGSSRLSGIYDVNGRLVFVTPGIGTSILPMRLGVPPEISRLTLRSATPDDDVEAQAPR